MKITENVRQRLGAITAVFLVFVCSFAVLPTHGASFDCAKAKSVVEKTICSDPVLSKLDEELDVAYKAEIIIDDTSVITRQQSSWLNERNDCSTQKCLKNLYTQRLKQLNSPVLPLEQSSTVRNDYKLPQKQYTNARFGYRINYPEDMLLPQGESDNGDGQRFISVDGDIEMTVSGINNVLNNTLMTQYKQDILEKDRLNKTVAYQVIKKDFYVISGQIKNIIYYQKTMLKDDIFMTLYITYPANQRSKIDPIVSEISKSFRYTGSSARPIK